MAYLHSMKRLIFFALLASGCGSKFTSTAQPTPVQSCSPAGQVVFVPGKPPEQVGGFCR